MRPAAVSLGVLIYTIALVASGWVAGKISDRTGRRKFLVAGSTLMPPKLAKVLMSMLPITVSSSSSIAAAG